MLQVKKSLQQAEKPFEDALRLHPLYRGKLQTLPKCPIRSLDDFAIWYTPGVAAPCRAIHDDPARVYDFTNKGNSVAIVSDGTRVLGLGDIGPEAGLPVMEGKALLFKYLGGVDAVPICLGTTDPDEIVRTVKILEPSFGAINLEDIAQPKCFRVLDELRSELAIPVWHDDQQGTATVVLAALINALKIVDKDLARLKIAMIGVGAANVAVYRQLKASGVDTGRIIACDTAGTLHKGRQDIAAGKDIWVDKWRICLETNADGVEGGIAEAMVGADVCIAFSGAGPGLIRPEWVSAMAEDAVVLACANPVPEIWPWEAAEAGARIVCSGRSDFPNQVNNSLCFPGVFRGVLDVQASSISEKMASAAAHELARQAELSGLREDCILPTMDDWEVPARIAAAVAITAQNEGLAKIQKDEETLFQEARQRIKGARDATALLMKEGLIPSPDEQ